MLGGMTIRLTPLTAAALADFKAKQAVRRARRVPELTQKALVRLAATPGREWGRTELFKSFCDSSTRTEFGDDVWEALLEFPEVRLGPEIVRGGRKIRTIAWHG